MRSLKLTILASLLLGTVSMHAQIRLGLLGGVSTPDIPSNKLLIIDREALDSFTLSAERASYGIHFGFFIRGEIGNFYIEPALIFNSNNVNFKVDQLTGDETFSLIKKESYQQLDVPLMLGYKFGGILRLGAGPVGHLFIDSSSELFDIAGYRQKFREMTWGWQVNFGVDIWLLRLDLRYEGDFSRYGDHFEFFGERYNFSKRPSRLIASAGITF